MIRLGISRIILPGKMGYALAEAAMLRGAEVTLISGPTAIEPPMFVNVIPIISAQEMFEKVATNATENDNQNLFLYTVG